jgi:hypothetical protein
MTNQLRTVNIIKKATELNYVCNYNEPLHQIEAEAELHIIDKCPTIYPTMCEVHKSSGGGQYFEFTDSEGYHVEQYGEIVNYMAEKRAGKEPGARIYYHKFVDSNGDVIALWTPMIEI